MHCKYHFHIQIHSRNYIVETDQTLKYVVVIYAKHVLSMHLLLVLQFTTLDESISG